MIDVEFRVSVTCGNCAKRMRKDAIRFQMALNAIRRAGWQLDGLHILCNACSGHTRGPTGTPAPDGTSEGGQR